MHEYDIKSLETGKVLQTITADGFTVGEGGIVTFYQGDKDTILRGGLTPIPLTMKKTIAVTQVSSSTLIIEKPAGKPEVVISFLAKPEDVVPIGHHQV